MHDIIPGADGTLDIGQGGECIQKTLQRLLSVDVPTSLIMQVMSPIVPVGLQPTAANALHLLRSSLCTKLVGSGLAAQASRMILVEIDPKSSTSTSFPSSSVSRL